MMIKGFSYYKNKFGIHTKEEINLGLERIESFLQELGNPQHDLKAIHIAGTNGKGSTLQFLRTILMEAGLQVGTFTSPHIIDVNDQISTNDGPISTHTFETIFEKLIIDIGDKHKIEELTDFELLTVLAIVYFSRIHKPDIVLFEVGMGGLNDSTNVLEPLLTIITNISIEHTAFLGDTIEKIAYQKAGIIKENVPSVTGVKQKEAIQVITEVANKNHSPLYMLNKDFYIDNKVDIGLKGEHQKENSSLAIMAAHLLREHYTLPIYESHIRDGLHKTTWPGRFEVVSHKPTIVLDGAHNPASIAYLVDTIKEEFPDKKVHFLFGAFKDKNVTEMIQQIEQIAEKITFVDFDSPRAEKAGNLFAKSNFHNKHQGSELFSTLEDEISQLSEEDVLVITGSLYLISEIKPNSWKFLKL